MRRVFCWLSIGVIGCAPLPGGTLVPDLSGQVDFGAGVTTQATLGEIGTAATVSLISSATNRTIRTTLTDSGGRFALTLPGFTPSPTEVYYLEAIKGLNNNQAGSSAARIRTLARYQGGWQTLTNSTPNLGIVLNYSTAAVSTIMSLVGTASIAPEDLIGKVAVGVPDASLTPTTADTFAWNGTGISNAQYHQVYGLVAKCVSESTDPTDRIYLSAGAFVLKSASGAGVLGTPPTLDTMVPTAASVGTFVTLYGSGFLPQNASNSISFNGTTTLPISASPTQLIVQVPAGCTSGPVTVTTAAGTSGGQSFTVTAAAANDVTGQVNTR